MFRGWGGVIEGEVFGALFRPEDHEQSPVRTNM